MNTENDGLFHFMTAFRSLQKLSLVDLTTFYHIALPEFR